MAGRDFIGSYLAGGVAGAVNVDQAVGSGGYGTATTLGSGRKATVSANTEVALAASQATIWIVIQAELDNTANIIVGATGIVATATAVEGVSLAPGDTLTLEGMNLDEIFIITVGTATEGVSWTYGV